MRAPPAAFHGHCHPRQIPLSSPFSTINRCTFPKPQVHKSRHVNGVRSLHAARKGRSTSQDEAFSTCTSCGSDEIVSASRILERGSIIVKCRQCGTRFTATAKEALTITGTPLIDLAETMKEEEAEKVDPNAVGVKLYISGLPPRVDSAALRRAIEEFGEVIESKVVVDRVTGRSRGFGFVTVKGRSTAAAIIDILSDDTRRLGTRLKVREAIE